MKNIIAIKISIGLIWNRYFLKREKFNLLNKKNDKKKNTIDKLVSSVPEMFFVNLNPLSSGMFKTR